MAQSTDQATVSLITVTEGDVWHYFKGATNPPADWKSNGFDHSSWLTGSSGIGYGPGSNRTYLSDMQNNYSTIYARHEFSVSKPHLVKRLNLSIVCDGPFSAYLNGIEMIRTNTVQAVSPDTVDLAAQAELFNVSGFKHELTPAKNVLSIQCENDDVGSSDFSFIPHFEVLGIEEVQQ